MIVDLIQTRSNLYAEYVFLRSDKRLGAAKAPFKLIGTTIDVDFLDRAKYTLRLDFLEDAKSTFRRPAKRSIQPFYIQDAGNNTVGYICGRMTRYIFGVFYYEISFEDNFFKAYEIGLGKEGLFINIFKDDEQICSVQKENITHDNKDVYRMYIHSERYFEVASLFMLYYDYYRWGNRGEIVYKKKSTQYVYSLNKELREKHNPQFIKSCDL